MTATEVARALDLGPRFLAYAASQGRTVCEQLAHDGSVWGSAQREGFLLWIQPRWVEFKTLLGMRLTDPASPALHDAFDAWLAEQFPVATR